MNPDSLNRVCRHLEQSRRVLAVTGSDLVAADPLPRWGGGGESDQLLAADTWRSQPLEARIRLAGAQAARDAAGWSRGHQVLQQMESYHADFLLATESVDGRARLAGCVHVAEIEGTLFTPACASCRQIQAEPDWMRHEISRPASGCPNCGQPLTPALARLHPWSVEEACRTLHEFTTRGVDLCLVLGADCRNESLAAALVAVWRFGGAILEFQEQASQMSSLAKECLRGPTELLLDEIWEKFLAP